MDFNICYNNSRRSELILPINQSINTEEYLPNHPGSLIPRTFPSISLDYFEAILFDPDATTPFPEPQPRTMDLHGNPQKCSLEVSITFKSIGIPPQPDEFPHDLNNQDQLQLIPKSLEASRLGTYSNPRL